ncbi:MAG: hypothetical protein K0Q79_1318 [Flavipsychrobacter sp.]|jgi:class 3 adenylate cyclase/Tfp pilus assembly protein PilF|nr:hypothetical protein [Flavipsychrobacter sp.]
MNDFLKATLLIVTLGFAFSASAQNRTQEVIDSLIKELASDKFKPEDSNRVKLMERIAFIHYSVNPEAGIKYGMEDLALAHKIGWEKGIALAYNAIAVNWQYKSAYDTAQGYYNKAVAIHEKIGNKKGAAGALSNIGYCYTLSGDLAKALDYNLKALTIFNEINDKPGIANTLGNIGSLYMNKGENSNALEYTFKALKMNEEVGSKAGVSANYGTIGSIYVQQKNFPKAVEYYKKALEINEALGRKNAVAGNYANMGNVFISQGKHSEALEYLFRALRIYEELGAGTGMAIVLGNIGQGYSELHNHFQSIMFSTHALEIAKQIHDVNAEAMLTASIGESYLNIVRDTALNTDTAVSVEFYSGVSVPNGLIPKDKKAILAKAKTYLEQGIEMGSKIGNMFNQYAMYQHLFVVDSMLGNYKEALASYQQYILLRDSVNSGEAQVKIASVEAKRELELKDKQIQLDQLAVEKKRNERGFFIAGIVLLLVVIVVVVRYSQAQKRSNTLLAKEKQRSEDLLLNILPAEVAEELKNKGSAAAKNYEDVTVLFTDFVNFTEAGERMDHQELIDELDACFKAFDEILGSYRVEKIKTIGDAYLAVCGLPLPDPQHAEHVVQAAIRINKFMLDRKKKFGDKTFEIRIGVHSGSVIAGIVGIKKFAYDIWGDTVNTAARMQQVSEPGKINISETTYELVKHKYPCLYRGEIEAKNKGLLKMYFVS